MVYITITARRNTENLFLTVSFPKWETHLAKRCTCAEAVKNGCFTTTSRMKFRWIKDTQTAYRKVNRKREREYTSSKPCWQSRKETNQKDRRMKSWEPFFRVCSLTYMSFSLDRKYTVEFHQLELGKLNWKSAIRVSKHSRYKKGVRNFLTFLKVFASAIFC